MKDTFQPIITIDENGRLEIDWSDSYIGSTDNDGNPADPVLDDKGYGPPNAELLDSLVANFTTAEALRRLASYASSRERTLAR